MYVFTSLIPQIVHVDFYINTYREETVASVAAVLIETAVAVAVEVVVKIVVAVPMVRLPDEEMEDMVCLLIKEEDEEAVEVAFTTDRFGRVIVVASPMSVLSCCCWRIACIAVWWLRLSCSTVLLLMLLLLAWSSLWSTLLSS